MSQNKIPSLPKSDQKLIEQQIILLQQELDAVLKTTQSFEALLYARLGELIIEAEELFVLYKQQKKAKKAKRLEQKKRGKNYATSTGLVESSRIKKAAKVSNEYQKEKKRLYREAMLHVHPDKFHMNESESEIATELTTRLIEIYKTESLETLQAFHAHIFAGNTGIALSDRAPQIPITDVNAYLLQEKERLQKAILLAKDKQLYKVVTEYENPMTFAEELRVYYERRIIQLKKRTRKG